MNGRKCKPQARDEILAAEIDRATLEQSFRAALIRATSCRDRRSPGKKLPGVYRIPSIDICVNTSLPNCRCNSGGKTEDRADW
jgi:hypothetical protein